MPNTFLPHTSNYLIFLISLNCSRKSPNTYCFILIISEDFSWDIRLYISNGQVVAFFLLIIYRGRFLSYRVVDVSGVPHPKEGRMWFAESQTKHLDKTPKNLFLSCSTENYIRNISGQACFVIPTNSGA